MPATNNSYVDNWTDDIAPPGSANGQFINAITQAQNITNNLRGRADFGGIVSVSFDIIDGPDSEEVTRGLLRTQLGNATYNNWNISVTNTSSDLVPSTSEFRNIDNDVNIQVQWTRNIQGNAPGTGVFQMIPVNVTRTQTISPIEILPNSERRLGGDF